MIFSDGFEGVNTGDDLQAALTRLERTGGVIHIAGRVEAKQPLRYESKHPVSIIGFGAGISGVVFTGNQGGLSVTVDNEFEAGAMEFAGFGLYATKHFDQTGFALASTERSRAPRQASVVRDLVLATVPGVWRGIGSFANGIHIHNMPHMRIDHPFLFGPRSGVGLYLSGDCTPGPVCTDVRAVRWGAGIGNSPEGATEGTRLHSCQLVNNHYGVWWQDNSGEPGLQIDGGHMSSINGNIVLKNISQASVRNMLFYRRAQSRGDFYDIDAQDIITLNVANNQSVIRLPGRTAVIRARNVSDLHQHGNNIQRRDRDRIVA